MSLNHSPFINNSPCNLLHSLMNISISLQNHKKMKYHLRKTPQQVLSFSGSALELVYTHCPYLLSSTIFLNHYAHLLFSIIIFNPYPHLLPLFTALIHYSLQQYTKHLPHPLTIHILSILTHNSIGFVAYNIMHFCITSVLVDGR